MFFGGMYENCEVRENLELEHTVYVAKCKKPTEWDFTPMIWAILRNIAVSLSLSTR